MTLPMNDDFSNCELSIEELEAIAAGWPNWVHSAVHAVENGLGAAVNYIGRHETLHKVFAAVVGEAAAIGGVSLLDYLTK
jgi:hypothetical protein